MRGSGITSEKNIIKILRSIFNFIFERSHQYLITPSIKRFDAKGEISRIEKGRDNMIEFIKIVPDECLIDLSNRWYCIEQK
jgi:hypothetical protein